MKKFVSGLLIGALTVTGTTAFAESSETIEAVFGRVKLAVNGTQVDKETLLYNGTTYVPLRAAAEALDLEVAWDGNSNTAYIDPKGTSRQLATAENASKEETDNSKAYPKGSRKNPYSLNEAVVSNLQGNKIELTFAEIIRGDKAKEIALEANKYADMPKDSEEFYLARVKVKALPNDEDKAVSMSGMYFDFYSSDGVELEFQPVAGFTPEFSNIFPGAQTEGWIKSIVPKNDNVSIAFSGKYEDEVWFNLNTGAEINVEHSMPQAEPETTEQATSKAEYTFGNPCKMGTTQRITVDSYSENYECSVSVQEILWDSEALNLVKEANRFSSDPLEGHRYVVVRVSFILESVEDGAYVSVDKYDFTAYSSKGDKYPRASVVVPDPEFDGTVRVGESVTGYVVLQTALSDNNPVMCFKDTSKDTQGWFRLYTHK